MFAHSSQCKVFTVENFKLNGFMYRLILPSTLSPQNLSKKKGAICGGAKANKIYSVANSTQNWKMKLYHWSPRTEFDESENVAAAGDIVVATQSVRMWIESE